MKASRGALALALSLVVLEPEAVGAHPLGNFSINHYTGLTVGAEVVELRYVIDLAEIPTFQEIQTTNIVPDPRHSTIATYLRSLSERLKERLALEVNEARLPLRIESRDVTFPPGVGDLPTMRIGIVYRASLGRRALHSLNELRYRDENFPGRAGWKEIVAVAGRGVLFATSSAPEHDRSGELRAYPTDLVNSPPQDLEARITFSLTPATPIVVAATLPPPAPAPLKAPRPDAVRLNRPPPEPAGLTSTLVANRPGTSQSAFTRLVTAKDVGLGVVLIAILTALGAGAAHALEPGHGKTVVAAYLVGSRGRARDAVVLGLVVTASHTIGVFLLGLVTLYASRYLVPEQIYPWLGTASGLTIAGLGGWLFLQRYAGSHLDSPHHHDHEHAHGYEAHDHVHQDHGHHHATPTSLRELFALGVTGGIVPCPAALVVLLSALALRRTGFGLVLIVAFSIGLASVLIAIGLLMVSARRFVTRVQGEDPVVTRWLPLASAAVMTILGVIIAVQALVAAGIVQVRL